MTQLETAEERLAECILRHSRNNTGYVPIEVVQAAHDREKLWDALTDCFSQPEPQLPPDVVIAYQTVRQILRSSSTG